MALFINIPDSANSEQLVTLGGLEYTFQSTFNSRDQRYRLSISQRGAVIIDNMKLMEGITLTGKYDLPLFDHGELFVIKAESTEDPIGRNNVGFNKPYELLYLTRSELQ